MVDERRREGGALSAKKEPEFEDDDVHDKRMKHVSLL